jgi:hypothetical protein
MTDKIASELIRIAKLLVAIDFPTKEAYDRYMKEHPAADKSNHKVVKTLMHGTNRDFKDFDEKQIGTHIDEGVFGKGFYFTNKEDTAKMYGKNIHKVKLNLKNPLHLDYTTKESRNEVMRMINEDFDLSFDKNKGFSNPEKASHVLQNKGYDGVIISHDSGENEYVVFNSHQIEHGDKLK